MKTTTPYTYLIGWPELDRWYYGSRYAKGCHPTELWVKYFTSSDRVGEFRKEHGEPPVRIIRKVFTDTNSVRLWEHRVLKKLKVIYSDRWLNKTDNKAIQPMPGELNPMFGRKGELSHRFGTTLPEESKKVIGEKSRLKKGNMPVGFSEKMRQIVTGRKHTDITKKTISIALTGRELTAEHKANISLNHADMSGENNPFFGKSHNKITRQLMSEMRMGKMWVSNNNSSRLINKDEVDTFINNGWTKGRSRKNGT